MWKHFAACIALCATSVLAADASKQPPVPEPNSRISAVTVYQSTARVTREVAVPAGSGIAEIVVGPLPPSTNGPSLFSEGGDGVRVLTTRYRTRPLQENIQEEVRKLEAQINELTNRDQQIQRQIQSDEQNLQLLQRLENFTASSLQQITEKGLLNSEAVTKLAQFIMDTRLAKGQGIIASQQMLRANQEQRNFLHRQMAQLAGASDKTIREAVIVVDRTGQGPGKVYLNYLVSAASWRPQYKLRAATDKPEVQVEYLAAISQRSGEDWSNVDVVLSTAQPMLSAAPPMLSMLEVTTRTGPVATAAPAPTVDGMRLEGSVDELSVKTRQVRSEAQQLAFSDRKRADAAFNRAAAFDQSSEILAEDSPSRGRHLDAAIAPMPREGQSVTFHLDRRLSIPWRDDEQLIEVTRLAMKPDYYYKAIPVLTPHVYRLADLTNDSKFVLLPGEATMYSGTDFVGRAELPLVAIGERFTAGFGVDPQLQVRRDLVDKTKGVQGGNQVLKFNYRILVSSYRTEPVKLQVWDRLPHSEGDAVNVVLAATTPALSQDPGYLRQDRPKNLLRWDLTIPPGTSGEQATAVNYEYRLEFAKDAAIDSFLSR